MQEKIKSQYLLTKLASYLDEEEILLLANYNKSLQNKLGRKLINYKIFSGKYIKCGKYTKGKIYNAFNNKIIFEDEFYNNKRNGNGKEYYDNEEGKLKFEGKYLNNRRNGKGKEYDYNGELKYEGEYLNGKRNGKGKEVFVNGQLKAEYEYINGKIFNMKEYDKNNNIINEINEGKG